MTITKNKKIVYALGVSVVLLVASQLFWRVFNDGLYYNNHGISYEIMLAVYFSKELLAGLTIILFFFVIQTPRLVKIISWVVVLFMLWHGLVAAFFNDPPMRDDTLPTLQMQLDRERNTNPGPAPFPHQ